MSTASSKLNFKHTARMQKIPLGNLGDASLSATDLIYNNSIPAILQYYTFSRGCGDLQWLTVSNKLSEVSRPVNVVFSEKPYVLH